MTRPELVSLARIVADWIDAAPGVPVAYIFGSRVRGDHRPDSDVDIRLFLHEWKGDIVTSDWWDRQNSTDFAELKAKLPGRLSLHTDRDDAADAEIREGAKNPVHIDRKAVCVWTPPRKR